MKFEEIGRSFKDQNNLVTIIEQNVQRDNLAMRNEIQSIQKEMADRVKKFQEQLIEINSRMGSQMTSFDYEVQDVKLNNKNILNAFDG